MSSPGAFQKSRKVCSQDPVATVSGHDPMIYGSCVITCMRCALLLLSQCTSNCLQLCSRCASGLAMQTGQEHTMQWRPSRYTPCSPLQHTGTCAVKILNI